MNRRGRPGRSQPRVDLVGPRGDGLRLDRDAGGVAEETVGAGEMGPGFFDRGGVLRDGVGDEVRDCVRMGNATRGME